MEQNQNLEEVNNLEQLSETDANGIKISDEVLEHIASTTPAIVAIKQVVPIIEPDNTTAIRIIIFTGSCFSL